MYTNNVFAYLDILTHLLTGPASRVHCICKLSEGSNTASAGDRLTENRVGIQLLQLAMSAYTTELHCTGCEVEVTMNCRWHQQFVYASAPFLKTPVSVFMSASPRQARIHVA
jgi:hypothetical protein